MENLLDRRERGLALFARRRIAIKRVLANVEIEGREIAGHEGRQQRHDFLVVIGGVGGAHLRVEFGQPMQHEPFQLRRIRPDHRRRACNAPACRASSGCVLRSLRYVSTKVFRISGPMRRSSAVIRRADPQAQNVGAEVVDHLLRRDHIAERLRHFAALLVEREAVRENGVIGRAVARAAAFEQRGMEPAAMLVRAFKIHDLVGAAVALAMNARQAWEMLAGRRARRRGCSRNRTTRRARRRFFRNRRDCARARGSASPRSARTMRRRLPARKPRQCARLRARRSSGSCVPFLTNSAIGTPQARWRDTTQSGRPAIMPVMRFWPAAGVHCVRAISARARWRNVFLLPLAGKVARRSSASDEGGSASGLSIAMNHCGVLRKITGFFERQRMRVLMLQAPARENVARSNQRADDGLIGVALVALLGDDALALEAGGVAV